MNCPVEGAVLEMSERQGVEIDYCPICRGVWLDRGELDKIIERSESWQAPATTRIDGPSFHRHDNRAPVPRKKKRTSFLSEMFDD
jgi:Zn-finger nucleic acid-binding protein